MPKLIVGRGLPGSGKTTWAREWVAADREHRARVSRDDIRTMVHGEYVFDPALEDRITVIEEQAVRALLRQGLDVFVDATHLRAKNTSRWFKVAEDHGAEVSFQDFPVPPEVAGDRDAERKRLGGRGVGRDVIFGLARRFHIKADGALPAPPAAPREPEGFPPYVPTGNLMTAWIVDIDGTLADMGDRRGPYEYDKVLGDEPHEDIIELVRYLSRIHDIVIVSGREGTAQVRADTMAWLDLHLGMDCVEAIFMRAEGDDRRDAVIKAELLHKEIAPRWDVVGVLDDRDRVVEAWRAMGIRALQVAPGKF